MRQFVSYCCRNNRICKEDNFHGNNWIIVSGAANKDIK